ncbi:MAG: molybdopterin-guanine dinucleotide biosynthesis protein B [Bacillota bacterium]|nr:molybdopterin-guanine dinucleotide biosynthesis protein B [Bacillota bacterium]
MKPTISFVGKHNAGKTTFLCSVVEELTGRGIRVAVIKHASEHLNISATTDSDQLFHAGAGQVCAISPDVCLYYKRQNPEPNLNSVLEKLSEEADLIITEGYKKELYSKIEIVRAAISKESYKLDNTVAIVSDFNMGSDIVNFSFQQAREVAEFIMDYFKIQSAN